MIPTEVPGDSATPEARRIRMADIRVMVTGSCGRMGREVVKAVSEASGMKVTCAVDRTGVGGDIGEICGLGPLGVKVSPTMEEALKYAEADVMVDFTVAEAALRNIKEAIGHRLRWVVGTTGIPKEEIARLMGESAAAGVAGVLAPNFAIGAVLMMAFSKVAARYMPDCEIIELHHDRKLDSPSGTAKATASAAAANGARSRQDADGQAPARGAEVDGIRVHSVRLPGLVAHQEVIFGGVGQILTIKHDSIGRDSFMPGVVFAIRKSMELDEPVFGLDKAMGLDF